MSWQELAKVAYQTFAVRWEDNPPSATVGWAAAAACLLPPAAMLLWGRGGLRLVGLCVLATFDGAVCFSLSGKNVLQSRYFVFANALLLCGLPPLLLGQNGDGSPTRQRGSETHAPRLRFGLVGRGILAALVIGMGWLALAHAERRDLFARRPGMIGAMAYLADVRREDEPVLVCNPLLQVTAAAHAAPKGGWPSQAVPNIGAAKRANGSIVQVLSPHQSFPYFQGSPVMRSGEYLLPEALDESPARRLWAIDAVDWIAPEWTLRMPQSWARVSQAEFPEWAAAESCRIFVRCYERRADNP